MPRSPLFTLVRRSLRLAHLSVARGEPADELVERAKVTRRQFVGTSLAAAGAVALEGCVGPLRRGTATTVPNAPREPVLIVGAGIAGLTAAYRLRQAGVPVRVVEAQNRIGGRMYSLRDHFPNGQVAELGGELIDSNHEHIRALAAELGIALDDLSTDDAALARDVWYFGGARRSEAEVVAAFRPVAAMLARDRGTVTGDGVSYREHNGALPLDLVSIAQWLDRHGVSGWVRSLLDVAYTTEYGLPIDQQSALNLLLMIDTEPDPFRVFGESDERYHVHAGNDSIPRALAAKLGDVIETGTVLESVRWREGEPVTCSLRRGETSVTARAPHALIAIPFTILRSVRLDFPMSEAKRRAIAELGYGTNAKLMVGFAQRTWRTQHGSNGSTMSDLPYQLTWETSRLQEGPTGILTNFTGGVHGVELGAGTAAEQAARLVADLEKLFPGISAQRAGMTEARFHWPSFPWTLGSYASYRTGQWTTFGGAEREPAGNVHFAGEHCSQVAQGFMEGGCETGEAAAAEILAALRASRDAARPAPPLERRAALRAFGRASLARVAG